MVQEFQEKGVQGHPVTSTLPRAWPGEGGILPDAAKPIVAVVQDGARLHYALPLALQREGMLGAALTDWFVRPGSREEAAAAILCRLSPRLGHRLAERRCSGLDSKRVVSSEWLALRTWLTRLRSGRAMEASETRLSARFADWVERQGWHEANCLMGFVRNIDPRLCEVAQSAGLVTVVDQMIAPAEVEYAALAQQAARWPAWMHRAGPVRPRSLIERERRTWQAADHITCPSAYVRAGLLDQGLCPGKVSEIAYPIDVGTWVAVDRAGRTGPVTVGCVGAVGLRKGAPMVFELARLFDPARVRFVMVGPVNAPPQALGSVGKVVLTGPVPRNAVRAHLRAFDIFLLPSACEGSAGAVMEAMASALPIVTTPSSGTPVRDGVDGFVRDANDLEGLATCLGRLTGDVRLRTRMGLAARQRAEEFGIEHYGRSLAVLLESLVQARQRPLRRVA